MRADSIHRLAFDLLLVFLFLIFWLYPPKAGAPIHEPQAQLTVTLTAYNSVVEQTDSDPEIAAWGDRLEPGMAVIAVSRDLIPRGLNRNARVRIEGLPGEYIVLDKMHRRHRKRIDLYMGLDIDAAKQFGRREVRINWEDTRSWS